jgi:UDP-GlcNAc:undecaprenyl-phosphate GlcNAc-1-phosphate transferase
MVFATVGVINALNMSDGVDGLASGYTVVALFGLIYLVWGNVTYASEQTLLLLLAAAVLGFMLLNVRSPWCGKAKVFMGDSGSMFLGFALAVAFIHLSQGDTKIMAPVTALWLFALPLMDTVSIIVRRKKKKQSAFEPGQDHIHHILQRADFSVCQIVTMGWATSIVLAIIGIVGYRFGVHDGIMFAGFMSMYFFYHYMISRALKKKAAEEA